MPYLNIPRIEGVYLIKHSNSNSLLERCVTKDGSQRVHSTGIIGENNIFQKWIIKANLESEGSEFTIRSAADGASLSYESDAQGSFHLLCKVGASIAWNIQVPEDGVSPSRLCTSIDGRCYRASIESESSSFYLRSESVSATATSVDDSYEFDPLFYDNSYDYAFFSYSVTQAKLETFDIIVVGAGFGGGVLAADLFETNIRLGVNAKKILVIEPGKLIFHSHCLNGARPNSNDPDRAQNNDSFFNTFKGKYRLSSDMTDAEKADWKGGPVYTLGGRSAVWGLFAPRVHDDVLRTKFPNSVRTDLLNRYYKEAEQLMSVNAPLTKPIHQDVMERLNMEALTHKVLKDRGIQWQWGRIASEFREDGNFEFPAGAYSTIDKLLEIAMSKPSKDNIVTEHPNFKQLLGAEVMNVVWDEQTPPSAIGVTVRTYDTDKKQSDVEIKLNTNGKVVLCAGSVNSPTILLRSNVSIDSTSMGGGKITDHTILYTTSSFRYKNPSDRALVGSMKLQTYLKLDSGEYALVNLAIDTSSFLPRGETPHSRDLPKLVMAIILGTELVDKNSIKLVDTKSIGKQPEITIRRSGVKMTTTLRGNLMLRCLTVLRTALNIELISDGKGWQKLQLGGVAHELGSLPMVGTDATKAHCVDDTLKLRDHNSIYICDLSVFPYSPEVNPTLTLAALALRLSRTLLPRVPDATALDADTLRVINQTGEKIKVWVSNRAAVTGDSVGAEVELKAGVSHDWKRKHGIAESVFVYKTDLSKRSTYMTVPDLFVGIPGPSTPLLIIFEGK